VNDECGWPLDQQDSRRMAGARSKGAVGDLWRNRAANSRAPHVSEVREGGIGEAACVSGQRGPAH
jgi:hypothetical protein